MSKYTTIPLSKIISETVTGDNIVFCNVDGQEGGRERKLNEPSIAASGYMVIIARLVSVADNDEDEEGKVKTNLLIVVPLFTLSGPALFVTDDPLSALSLFLQYRCREWKIGWTSPRRNDKDADRAL